MQPDPQSAHDTQSTPGPEDVVAGYSRPRPPITWRYRALVATVGVVGLGAVLGFTKITYDDLPRTWVEEPPVVTLSAEQVAAAHAVPSYDNAVPVLAYHFVTSRTDNDIAGTYTTTTEDFAEQMALLDEAGFSTITAEQARAFVEDGEKLPDKPMLLTFDDGHATNRDVVDPILEQHGFNAVGFLITGRITTDDTPANFHLSLADVAALEASGRWEFGSHTHALHQKARGAGGEEVTMLDHLVVTENGELETDEEYSARIEADLSASREWMQAHLEDPLWQFAYPMGGRGTQGEGAMEDELHKALRANGFVVAFAVGEHEAAHSMVATTAALAQPRIDMERDTTALDMLSAIVQSLPEDVGGEQPTGWFDGWYEGWDSR